MSGPSDHPFRFHEVDQAPTVPGIYAWYHQVTIPEPDIDAFVGKMPTGATERSEAAARDIVREFLTAQVFAPHKETPYNVTLSGALKPEFNGTLEYRPPSAQRLVEELSATPERAHMLASILLRAVPFFSSPIYIGIAKSSLRQRLQQHAKLISDLRNAVASRKVTADARVEQDGDPTYFQDHQFAREAIVVRKLSPLDLLVYVLPLEVDPTIATGVEYLLNRINYPLCGRN